MNHDPKYNEFEYEKENYPVLDENNQPIEPWFES